MTDQKRTQEEDDMWYEHTYVCYYVDEHEWADYSRSRYAGFDLLREQREFERDQTDYWTSPEYTSCWGSHT